MCVCYVSGMCVYVCVCACACVREQGVWVKRSLDADPEEH